MSKYLILPGCDDGNRGDQALVWQTKEFAEKAGFKGSYSMLCMPETIIHSKNIGIETVAPILGHPSRKFKNKDNSKYGVKLLVQWGSVAICDYLFSTMILNRWTRKFAKSFLSKEAKKSFYEFENSDAFFVKGGGFIHSYGGITDIYQIYFFLYHIRLALSLKKDVYIMPNSFGPFNAPTIKRQVRKVLSKCKVVTARESISQKMLMDICVENFVYPDLAFSLKKSDIVIPELDEIKKKAGQKKLVAITVRPYRFPGCNDSNLKYQNYISSLKDTCIWLFDNGYFPILTEHVISNLKNESDMCGIEAVTNRLPPNTYYVFANNAYSCADMKKFYSQMYFVIGTRFHSVIFSLGEKVPCIAITYGGNKGDGIMKDMDISDFSMPINEITFDNVKNKIINLEKNYSVYKEKLELRLPEIQAKHDDLVRKIANKEG